jgi:two-component system, OmpR family, phosphate regulon sensor histidine kinase PhoR
MIARWLACIACLLVGALVGHFMQPGRGMALGVAAGTLAWLALDSLFLARLLGWLRSEQGHSDTDSAGLPLPMLQGIWGEIGERFRRLLKIHNYRYTESQARLAEFLAALQASPSAVVLLDSRGCIEWCNQMATQHFGIDTQRDLQQQITNLVRAPSFSAYMAGHDFSHGVTIAGHLGTSARPVTLSVQVYPYGGDRKLLLSRDITAVELAEAMRRDFVANVSHEIRSPLTVLAGFIETLQTMPVTAEERTRYLGMMAQQARRMQTLVSDLLTLSKLEGSPLPNGKEWIASTLLMAQCEQEARALSAVVAPKGQRITFDAGPACEIAGVHAELYSAMSNLITNAVRYTPEGGEITVAWSVLASGEGVFAVKDSGPGIAAEHLPRLTERFYRVDRSRSRDTGGTGLGLAIAKHVAQRHGAVLHIESELSRGSVFSVVFPAARVRHSISGQP